MLASSELGIDAAAAGATTSTTMAITEIDDEQWVTARVVLTRVGPVKKGGFRTVCFAVNGSPQEVEVRLLAVTTNSRGVGAAVG